nr:hypothetical protein Iba_chr14bCG0370 [Ipomoea batatas]
MICQSCKTDISDFLHNPQAYKLERKKTHRDLIADTEKRKCVRASIEMLAFIHHLKITASSPARLQESLLPFAYHFIILLHSCEDLFIVS